MRRLILASVCGVLAMQGQELRFEVASLGAHVLPSGDDPAPDIFAAFEKQLGLKLEKGKIQIDLVTIDHLDREPSEN
jgi:uncharacterized protein (TIGR03435 family)